eukprot:scaffold14521_cov121-Isochrysis_galbana.AAC.9
MQMVKAGQRGRPGAPTLTYRPRQPATVTVPRARGGGGVASQQQLTAGTGEKAERTEDGSNGECRDVFYCSTL